EEFNTWLKSQVRRDPKAGRHKDILLRPGVNAELQDRAFAREVDAAGNDTEPHTSFIRIVDIIQDTRSRAVTLRGWIFQRAQYLNGLLEKKRNEVCWILHVEEDDTREMQVQAMETVPVEDVIRRRRILLTNQPWPKLSFREDPSCFLEDSDDVIRNERILVCRYKYISYYISADRRAANSWTERELQRLRNADCDKWSGCEEPCAINDKELRKAWRGETIPGGAYVLHRGPQHRPEFAAPKDSIDLTDEAQEVDPKTTITSPSSPRLDGYHSRITNVTRRNGWTTDDALPCYPINSFVLAKRCIETIDMTRSTKSHQGRHLGVNYKVPPRTVSMLDELRRKCSVFEIEPPKPQSKSGSKRKQSTSPIRSRKTSNHRPSSTRQQYTFSDSFCGAGGMSRAAHQSGLHIKYAFDCNKNACRSYKLNFPEADIRCLWADEFVRLLNDCKVDMAHFSPPCQFFSDSHTIAGKDDEMNTASLFAVGELLKKFRPRVVTLEQTFGIVLRARHQGYLNALVQVFASHGFSVRWRLLHCADYGLPQMRLRTFMIAS
ncbi:MAG: hypothetical protein Q9224_006450, partial [Gallowayella concinna]